VTVKVPADVLYDFFLDCGSWPLWNRAFHWVFTSSIDNECEQIAWTFNSVNSSNTQLLPNVGTIVALNASANVTWINEVAPLGVTLYFGRHEFFFISAGSGTVFGSWEKAYGQLISTFTDFFLDQFTFVMQSSLSGVQCLESVYQQYGTLNASIVQSNCAPSD